MEGLIITLGWIGIFAPVSLGAVGSSIGCSIAGQSACGAILDIESGYGKFIGLSAMPSSQVIYGIVIMFTLRGIGVTETSSPGLFAVGLLTGISLMYSAIYQGQAVASAINASKNKPEVFGISIAPAAIVEGFAVFAFVFALVIGQSITA
ncbi:MAG: ATP synthase subunit C [Candidatus Endonucleobacter bathymodioli]|uniref:ATP synthase subunit C n=1 Tax=Candidatus Endonucleibacter bathymodioli TaxID=539814 RepID=A0AA90NNI7_9GAMM|nr:ATP synthase subunit C [Candidatus Endonucleobacter bathymodioli]